MALVSIGASASRTNGIDRAPGLLAHPVEAKQPPHRGRLRSRLGRCRASGCCRRLRCAARRRRHHCLHRHVVHPLDLVKDVAQLGAELLDNLVSAAAAFAAAWRVAGWW